MTNPEDHTATAVRSVIASLQDYLRERNSASETAAIQGLLDALEELSIPVDRLVSGDLRSS
ncbi:hypothetical protein MTY66_61800 (plasmid) [Mycolicibacterium sp. TY66]|nr:hypothetical protein MTY66_61800 [Mycolicibacterium sp. TY66]BCJ84785.1 hypothetical protein MTY81_61580 [Mycolicibacterium sp. TY81]